MAEVGKRDQILEAAAGVFSKTGYHGARVEDIAIKAGIGKGTVYEYFKSKRELFEETIFHVLEGSFKQAVDSVNRKKTPTEKLKALIDLQASLLKKDGDIAALFMRNPGDIHTEMLDRLLAHREKILGFIASIIEEGIEKGIFRPVDSRLAAVLFMGVLQEAGTISCTGSKVSCQTIDTVLDYLINGIGK